jgi:lysine 2,3-aminomutase
MRGRKKRNESWYDWRWQLQHAVRSVEELVELGLVEPDAADALASVVERYPLCITPYYLNLAETAQLPDPILLQCLPDVRELDEPFDVDPFAEDGSTEVPGLVQRYPDRALVMTTSACAVACRHCTRKNLLGDERQVSGAEGWEAVCRSLRRREAVREVILSGGDPLLLESDQLDRMLSDLHAIPHIEVIRIGTRVPVVLPMRIDDALAELLATHRPLWVNTQFNHPSEVTPEAIAACDLLISKGIPVSNQAVLLRGVNDDVDTLRDLCNSLQRNMIRPYYVFQCDPVRGTGHFHTDLAEGLKLDAELRGSLGGLAMPRFVADLPGSGGKTPLAELAKERKVS